MPTDSSGPASKRHFFTASSAAPASKGWPPTSFVFFTSPLDVTVTSILTTPLRLMRFASSGYTGATLVLTLRVISCWPHASEELAATHPPSSSRPTATVRFRTLKDTEPPLSQVLSLIFREQRAGGYRKFFLSITLVIRAKR